LHEKTNKFIFYFSQLALSLHQNMNVMNKLREFGIKYKSYTKFFIVLLFAAVIFSIGDASIFNRMKYKSQISSLKKSIKHYREKIASDSILLEMFNNNPESIEKFAREQYLMKRDNEDVFVFDE